MHPQLTEAAKIPEDPSGCLLVRPLRRGASPNNKPLICLFSLLRLRGWIFTENWNPSYFLPFFSKMKTTTKKEILTSWWQILSFLLWNKLRQLVFSLPYFQLLNCVWSVPVLTTREPLIVGFSAGLGTCSAGELLGPGAAFERAGGPSQGCEPSARLGSQAEGCAGCAPKFKLNELRPWRTIPPAASAVLGSPLKLPFLRNPSASPHRPPFMRSQVFLTKEQLQPDRNNSQRGWG